MKFSINSGTLSESINAAVTSMPARPTAAILGGVLVEASTAAVTMSTTNYDRATARTANAVVTEPDVVVTSGRLLSVIASNLPKNTEAHVATTGNEMVVTAGRTEFRLPLMHHADYPDLPSLDDGALIGTVNSEAFADAVRIVGGFASTDPEPVNVTALHITCDPREMVLTATDRYIIGRRKLDWNGSAEADINVTATDLLATIKAVNGSGADDIDILWNGSLLGLRTPATTVVTRLLAEEFPNIDRIMATDTFIAASTVSTAQLSSMLRRAATIADDKLAQVDITVEDNTLSVTTTNSSTGNVVDSAPAQHHGTACRLALSSWRLANVLSIVDTSDVTLAFREKGLLLTVFPGPIEPDLRPPDVDSSAALMGIRSPR